jgi:hypothetical protein
MINISFYEARERVAKEVSSWYIDILNDTIRDVNHYGNIKTQGDLQDALSVLPLYASTFTHIEKEHRDIINYVNNCMSISELLMICNDEERFGLFLDHEEVILTAIMGVGKIQVKYSH